MPGNGQVKESDMELISYINTALIAATFDPANLVVSIRNILTPIFALIVGVVSIKFLLNRQLTQLIQFIGIAILVGALLFSPEIIQAMASWGAGVFTD
jgi:hypothetical protein